MNVKILAEVLHGYAGALNVPAGIADAPGRVPFERLILELGLCKPQNEVVLVALVYVLLNALAHAYIKIVGVKVVENIVAFKLRGVEINVAAGKICIARVHELGDDLDILVDAVCCRLNNVGGLDVELCAVGEECVGVELCYFHYGLVLALCALEHLVLALVGVAREVADVGNIHNALNVIADVAQILFKNVLHDVRAEVSDVRKVVHRRATGVHLDYIRMIGNKVLFLSCCRIIKLHN